MKNLALKLATAAVALLLAACPAGSSAAPAAAKVVLEYTLGTGETGKNVVDWCVAAKPCVVSVGELAADAKKRGAKVDMRFDFLFYLHLAIPPQEKALAKLDRDDYVIIRGAASGTAYGAGWQLAGDWPKRADTKPTPPGPHVYEPQRKAYWYWTWEDLTEAPLTIDLVNKRTKETAKVTLTFSAVEPAKGG